MKKYILLPFVFITGVISGCYPFLSYHYFNDSADNIEICFTPSMKCLPLIQQTLQEAHESIYIQTYSFTSKPIANELLEAHKKGIHIEIIADQGQSQSRYSQIPILKESGIPIWIDDSIKGLHHNKIIIIDESKVICGSYNFSDAAENRNAENLLIIDDEKIAEKFLKNWQKDLDRIQNKLNKKISKLEDLKLNYNKIENELINTIKEKEDQFERFNLALKNFKEDKEESILREIKCLLNNKKINEDQLKFLESTINKINHITNVIIEKRKTHISEMEEFLKPTLFTPMKNISSVPRRSTFGDIFSKSKKNEEVELQSFDKPIEGFSPPQKTKIKSFINNFNDEIYKEVQSIHYLCINKLIYPEESIISF